MYIVNIDQFRCTYFKMMYIYIYIYIYIYYMHAYMHIEYALRCTIYIVNLD